MLSFSLCSLNRSSGSCGFSESHFDIITDLYSAAAARPHGSTQCVGLVAGDRGPCGAVAPVEQLSSLKTYVPADTVRVSKVSEGTFTQAFPLGCSDMLHN